MKFEVNIEKKYAFGIIASILILASILAVYAYNTAGNGNPAIMGHSADEIEGILQVIQGNFDSFGIWEVKSLGEVYQASTNGFIFYLTGYSTTRIFADNNPNPTTLVGGGYTSEAEKQSFLVPIKKGQYWRVTGNNLQHLYWIPLENSKLFTDPEASTSAFVNFNGAACTTGGNQCSIRSSSNINRIERIAVGRYNIYFQNNLSSDFPVVSGSSLREIAGRGSTIELISTSKNMISIENVVVDSNPQNVDSSLITIAVFS